MSEIEKLEAEHRVLARKIIGDELEGGADPADRDRLDRLSEDLIRLDAADFRSTRAPEPFPRKRPWISSRGSGS